MNRVHFTSKAQDWGTPRYLFDFLHNAFKFDRDVCAEPGNAKLKTYWTERDDALVQNWEGANWMNNPYKHAEEWTRKARHEAIVNEGCTMGLIPARTSERWWQKNIQQAVFNIALGPYRRGGYFPEQRFHWMRWEKLKVWVHFIDHRIPFVKPGKTWTAPFPSALVIWEPGLSLWGENGLARLDWRELERPKASPKKSKRAA